MGLIIIILAIAIITLGIGFALGIVFHKKSYEKTLDVATQTAQGILKNAKKEAEAQKKRSYFRS